MTHGGVENCAGGGGASDCPPGRPKKRSIYSCKSKAVTGSCMDPHWNATSGSASQQVWRRLHPVHCAAVKLRGGPSHVCKVVADKGTMVEVQSFKNGQQ
eukprot:2650643-Amphidinium_carterae.1